MRKTIVAAAILAGIGMAGCASAEDKLKETNEKNFVNKSMAVDPVWTKSEVLDFGYLTCELIEERGVSNHVYEVSDAMGGDYAMLHDGTDKLIGYATYYLCPEFHAEMSAELKELR